MQPALVVEREENASGAALELARRGEEWVVRSGRQILMSTRQHSSEEALAKLAIAKWFEHQRIQDPPVRGDSVEGMRVMIGGLGLGFTARAALDRIPAQSRLTILEFSPAIARWNQIHLGDFAKRPLEDPRVELQIADAVLHIKHASDAYDLILLDIDNGPSAMVLESNDRLYSERGIASCGAALKANGVLAIWSAGPDEKFLRRLDRGGFRAAEINVSARDTNRGTRHTIFVALKK